jgi:hypothetical protein
VLYSWLYCVGRTQSEPWPLVALAVAMAPLREIDELYAPTSENEDWDKYLKWETLKRKCIIYIFAQTWTVKERMTLH